MYLKSMEMVGFKSFADKTRMEFEPGMTAIVGPNGCGKSNVSDAIRWVLGEQSAKAMRGAKMTDCIFNGTDERKPLAMAEVSITFADCEQLLDIEYDEVTVSRRVFQSGEGQYLINKAPCRLKDVQRLFMDTGIGTSSYSFMQQGRIDQLLSSRPEDRREVFEEASGITKYKSDKKEAIRKLEYTEANLLRLADVIREVKRQIGSLQRQAGKARRYRTLSVELRGLDIFAIRKRLQAIDAEIAKLQSRMDREGKELAEAQQEVAGLESGNAVMRESLFQTEREIGAALESAVTAQSKLDHTRDVIQMNRKRIEEYRAWSQRDSREIELAQKQMEEQGVRFESFGADAEKADAEKEQAEKDLKQSTVKLSEHRTRIDQSRATLQKLREESVELESLTSRLQNQLMEIETRQRAEVVRKERLAAEQNQLSQATQTRERRRDEMREALSAMQADVDSAARAVETLEQKRKQASEHAGNLQQELSLWQSDLAAQQMKVDMLREQDSDSEDSPAGARLLLDGANPLGIDRDRILGAMGSLIDVDKGYEAAAEASLRSWLDAVIVADHDLAMQLLRILEERKEGPARIVAAGVDRQTAELPEGADPLLKHIRCTEQVLPVIRTLVGHVVVVESLDPLPSSLPEGTAFVTRGGSLVHGNGRFEFWMTDSTSSPISRRRLLSESQAGAESLAGRITEGRQQLVELQHAIEAVDGQLLDSRTDLDSKRRLLAQNEGECQVITREADEARDRLETVKWELESIVAGDETGGADKKSISTRITEVREQREKMTGDIATLGEDLHKLEDRHSELQSESTERRVTFAEVSHRLANLQTQRDTVEHRLRELDAIVAGRTEGIQSYETNIEELTNSIADSESRIESFELAAKQHTEHAESLGKNREKQSSELKKMEQELAAKRLQQEEIRERRSKLEVGLMEQQVRRQNLVERSTAEYKMTFEELLEEDDPEWKDGEPELDVVETRVAELRTKLEAMGPVNLVAIEEHKELEERFTFLTAQEQDLVNAKRQLMELIRKINRTTTEMFSKTFDQVNENFQVVFTRLFDGGNAKLVLVNEEDVLECGIEIIARPPGKRLQNVSLLSGGERTLTAVALLFAIYMIKPSPFCMLDELDAALDDANIGRFVDILKGFLKQSQFVVITHNRNTIAAADVIYGVTMPQRGISGLVSMKFSDESKVPEGEMALA